MLFAEDLYSPSQVEELAKKGMIVEKEISKSEQKSFDKALKLDRAKPDVAILGERATIQDFWIKDLLKVKLQQNKECKNTKKAELKAWSNLTLICKK